MGRSRRSTKRPWAAEHPELDLDQVRGSRRVESTPRGDWTVQSIGAAGATKTYRCPGCLHDIPPGTAHVVAWANDSLLGPAAALAERRHWHTACWRRDGHRR